MNNVHLHIIGSKSFPILLNELDLNYTITSDANLKYNHKDLLIRIIFVEKLKQIEIKKYFNENIPTIFLLTNRDFLQKKLSILYKSILVKRIKKTVLRFLWFLILFNTVKKI